MNLNCQIENSPYINAHMFDALIEAAECVDLDAAAKVLNAHIAEMSSTKFHVYKGGNHVALVNDNANRGKRVAIITEK